MTLKIWLDDVREPPDNSWTWVKNAGEATEKIASSKVTHISFDHDLGDFIATGYDVAKTIEYWSFIHSISRIKWFVHSANPVGRRNIEMAMRNADKHWSQNENQIR